MTEVNPIAGVVAAGLREARLRDERVPVLPCERDHADYSWHDILNSITSLPDSPEHPRFLLSGRRIFLGEHTEPVRFGSTER